MIGSLARSTTEHINESSSMKFIDDKLILMFNSSTLRNQKNYESFLKQFVNYINNLHTIQKDSKHPSFSEFEIRYTIYVYEHYYNGENYLILPIIECKPVVNDYPEDVIVFHDNYFELTYETSCKYMCLKKADFWGTNSFKRNPNAIHLLENNLNKINWKYYPEPKRERERESSLHYIVGDNFNWNKLMGHDNDDVIIELERRYKLEEV